MAERLRRQIQEVYSCSHTRVNSAGAILQGSNPCLTKKIFLFLVLFPAVERRRSIAGDKASGTSTSSRTLLFAQEESLPVLPRTLFFFTSAQFFRCWARRDFPPPPLLAGTRSPWGQGESAGSPPARRGCTRPPQSPVRPPDAHRVGSRTRQGSWQGGAPPPSRRNASVLPRLHRARVWGACWASAWLGPKHESLCEKDEEDQAVVTSTPGKSASRDGSPSNPNQALCGDTQPPSRLSKSVRKSSHS